MVYQDPKRATKSNFQLVGSLHEEEHESTSSFHTDKDASIVKSEKSESSADSLDEQNFKFKDFKYQGVDIADLEHPDVLEDICSQ